MRKLKVVTFSILCLSACVISIAAQSSPVASVPMQMRGAMPVIEAMVNGQGPFVFAIDTGGEMQADIDTATAAQLKLQPNGKVRGGDPSGRNSREFDTVAIASIAFGDVEFRNVTAITREHRITPNYPKVAGILGFSLFADYLLTLDYPGKQVRLSRGELPPANGADILSFDDPHRIPVVELAIGNLKVRAHLDSGNLVGGFILPTSLVEKLTLASPAVTVGRARSISNEVEIKEARLKDSIKLGSFVFPQPTITFPALADESNIGIKILRDFSLTFDQKNKRLKLLRQITKVTNPAPATSPAEVKEFVGSYGQREISFAGDALYLQRQGGPKMKLVPGAKDEFTLEAVPEARIKFGRDANGRVTELHVLNIAGEWEISKKAQP